MTRMYENRNYCHIYYSEAALEALRVSYWDNVLRKDKKGFMHMSEGQ